jgi:hypothetical protein
MDRNVPEPLGATGSTERAPRSPNGMPRQHPEGHFGRGPRRDLVDQCSAYACTMRAHARRPRRTTSTCRSPRTRSSAAALHRAHSAYACVCRADKVPRNTPEKLASPTSTGTRNRCSGACTPARDARLTSGLGGGGSVGYRAARTSGGAKVLVDGLCLCSPLGAALLNVAAPRRESPETAPFLRVPSTFGFLTRRSRRVESVGLSHQVGPASAILRRGAAPRDQGRCAGRRRRGRPPRRLPRAS